MDIRDIWAVTIRQDGDAMSEFFDPDAEIRWHNTNERFTVEEYIRANCEYPGDWDGEVERIETIGDLIITVTHVFSKEEDLSFHATSFFKLKDDNIISLDEYWGDDSDAPTWRLEKQIGRSIK